MNAAPPRRTLRRIGALFAGLVTIIVLSTVTDTILHATGIYPAPGQPMATGLWVLATAYRVVIAVFGCWLTARLAPDRPMALAMTLGAIGVVLSTLGVMATWGKGPAFGPMWYPLGLVASALPCAWLGGWFRMRQLRVSH